MTLRILFAFVGGRGHPDPLVPIAVAARSAGDTVAFTCSRSMTSAVEAAGFEVVDDPEAPPRASAAAAALADAAPGAAPPGPLRAVDRAREERDLREKFVADAGRREAARILRTAPAWRADVIVCDEADLGAVVAAERLGILCATVIVLAAGGMLRPDVVAATLDEVRAEHGLAPDPGLAVARGSLVVDPTPPGYRDPGDPLLVSAIRVALVRPSSPESTPRPWQPVRPHGPAVYVTPRHGFPARVGRPSGPGHRRVRRPSGRRPGHRRGRDRSGVAGLGAAAHPSRAVRGAGGGPPPRRAGREPRRLRDGARRARAWTAHGPPPDGRRPALERRPVRGNQRRPRPRPGPRHNRRHPGGRARGPCGSGDARCGGVGSRLDAGAATAERSHRGDQAPRAKRLTWTASDGAWQRCPHCGPARRRSAWPRRVTGPSSPCMD